MCISVLQVLLIPVKGILAADRVDVEPVSVDDWEILVS